MVLQVSNEVECGRVRSSWRVVNFLVLGHQKPRTALVQVSGAEVTKHSPPPSKGTQTVLLYISTFMNRLFAADHLVICNYMIGSAVGDMVLGTLSTCSAYWCRLH